MNQTIPKKYFFLVALALCSTRNISAQKTQTEACLDRYKTEIKNDWKNSAIAKKCIEQEKKYNDSHYVFYHAQVGSLRILQDFLKELYTLLNIKPLSDFEFIRPWYANEKTTDVNTFIDNEEKGSHHGWYDHRSDLRNKLLSVNISLFGNHYNYGECTYDYFKSNLSIGAPAVKSAIEKIFTRFNLNKNYVYDVLGIMKGEDEYKASLFQILIPKKIIDQCVYLSHAYGTPYRNNIVVSCFDKKKERHTKISTILEKCKKDPKSIEDLGTLQARILLGQDIVLNPESDIKLIRYVDGEQNSTSDYQEQLSELANTIVTESLEKNEMINADNTKLARLTHYIALHNNTQGVTYGMA